MKALKKLINETKTRYLMLSYSLGGRATKDQLLDIISGSGKLLEINLIDYKKNVISNMRSTNNCINKMNIFS
jgi:adenine-specific DNA-methyltransferase